MRAAIWFLALFGVASAVALFAGNNQGTVTVFWPPWRIDLSLNLVVLSLLAVFVFLYVALRAISALLALPRQARQWRLQQKERALHMALLEALTQLLAGRFSRARKAAQSALAQQRTLEALDAHLPQAQMVRVTAHLLAAESAQALQDRASRDAHLQLAINDSVERSGGTSLETHEGAQLLAARWALSDRDAPAALEWLAQLPQGARRRTLAQRLHLKAARLDGRTREALETARLLAKHRAFSEAGAHSIIRGLAIDLLSQAHDSAQLMRAWAELEPGERAMPDVAIHAAQRQVALQGDLGAARDWLLPVWERMVDQPQGLGEVLQVRLTRVLDAGLGAVDADWLARIEAAQRANPRDANLQYLAGMACLKRQLWGKAQQLLAQAGNGLQDLTLHRQAWQALARMAEDRGDVEQAAAAWKYAAQAVPRAL